MLKISNKKEKMISVVCAHEEPLFSLTTPQEIYCTHAKLTLRPCYAQRDLRAEWRRKGLNEGRVRLGNSPIEFGARSEMRNYKNDKRSLKLYLPGRGRSVVKMADGLGDPAPLH